VGASSEGGEESRSQKDREDGEVLGCMGDCDCFVSGPESILEARAEVKGERHLCTLVNTKSHSQSSELDLQWMGENSGT
jgi:hypothetical protein